MKISKLILLTTILLYSTHYALAGDFAQPFNYIENPDVNMFAPVENATGMEIFDDNSKKVIHTKGRTWRTIFTRGRKNKEEEQTKVIDYNTDTPEKDIVQDEPVEDKVIDTNKTEKTKKIKKSKQKENTFLDANSSNVNIYCDNMEYLQDKKEIVGTGNAKVIITENNSTMTADKIVYNHDLNYIEGIDNVRIVRDGKVMDGDYTKIDLNYGNAMMDNPLIDDYLVRVSAKSGLLTADTLEAYDGIASVKEDMEARVYSAQHAAFFQMEINQDLYRKFYPKEYRNRGTKYHIKTKELFVNSSDGHDVLTFKNSDIYFGKLLLMKGANMTLSTDKEQSFVETTIPEIGSMRYVGMYLGPGFVFNTPMSSTLKLAPIVTKDGPDFGVGILARFRHKRNVTQAIYSSAANQLVLRGRQQFGDSDFFLEYAHMSYINDWFLGANISKYLVQLAYQKQYLYPELGMSISHRATAGYLTDEYGHTGTARFRYQAQYTKNLFEYIDYNKKFMAAFDVIAQGMMGVYGTGDSTGVFRVGPNLRTQYRGWGQQITYFQSAKGGASPLIYTDDYRYGNSNLQIIESLRLNKYISIAYLASLNLQDTDVTTKNMFSESRVMISFGPEDAKLSLGYDMIRQSTMLNYTALIGSKNQDISFKKLFMNNPDKLAKKKPEKQKKGFKLFGNSEEKINTKSEEQIPQDVQAQPDVFDIGET